MLFPIKLYNPYRLKTLSQFKNIVQKFYINTANQKSMVLESLVSPFKVKHKPWITLIIGFLYALIAVFLGNWIFKEYASLLIVFLTVAAAIPFMYITIKYEEQIAAKNKERITAVKEHAPALAAFVFLFIGFVLAYVVCYCLLPLDVVQRSFHVQTLTIQAINSKITASTSAKMIAFKTILFNNLKVLLFCIIFSFLYGAGAIFILAWNASVVATAIGNFIRTKLSYIASLAHAPSVAAYFQIVSIGLLRYLTHGIFEITSYFIAGLAGGLISVAMIRESIYTKRFSTTMLDAANLLIIAILILILAAFIEVWITPALFH
ncbi:hypothetical protein DRJ19_00935 [Candidatus Woesearchaeota archaeon]|nr:MAG: hypothetical protein DRJ19_00935 [Candidatus Woesearchaeota archaeon]